MVSLTIGEWRPDIDDLNRQYTAEILNVVPRADGYGPFRAPLAYSAALAGQCRGFFAAREADGSVAIFAATSTKIYLMDATTLEWTDVSKGGSTYATLNTDANWSFAQFNNFVVATQINAPPQVYDLASSSAFADIGGSPPQAAFASVVNRFLVLSRIASALNRVQWSDVNDITEWSAGLADSQDLPTGGAVMGLVGGDDDFGLIFQQDEIRRMTFVPGDTSFVFQINRIARDTGLLASGGLVDVGGVVYFVSQRGFASLDPINGISYIGRAKVDRFFLGDWNSGAPALLSVAADPDAHRIIFAYQDVNSGALEYADRALVFDTLLQRWSPLEINSQIIGSTQQPGVTFEGLDYVGAGAITGAADNGSGLIRLTMADTSRFTTGDPVIVLDVGGTTEANGPWTVTVIGSTTIDLQGSTFSNAYTSGGYVNDPLDVANLNPDAFPPATAPTLGVFDTSNRLSFFRGDFLEATVETSEQSGIRQRLFVRGFWPVTDAATVSGSILHRANLSDDPTETEESDMTSDGLVPVFANARHVRGKVRIPAGTSWSFVSGVEPDAKPRGRW